MSDHVQPTASGIAARHRDAIEEIMKERNCFLFVRPTEYDSTILIEEVNKEAMGTPNPNPVPHAHGQAAPMKLELPWSLYQRFRGDAGRLDRVRNRYLLLSGDTVVLRTSVGTSSGRTYRSSSGAGSSPTIR